MLNFLLIVGCKHGINSTIIITKIIGLIDKSCIIIKSENEKYGSMNPEVTISNSLILQDLVSNDISWHE